jgi:hypothetical protein
VGSRSIVRPPSRPVGPQLLMPWCRQPDLSWAALSTSEALGLSSGPVRRIYGHNLRKRRRQGRTGREQAAPNAPRSGGSGGLGERVETAWRQFVDFCDGWVDCRHGYGPDAVERVYTEFLEGRPGPAAGHMLSMCPST